MIINSFDSALVFFTDYMIINKNKLSKNLTLELLMLFAKIESNYDQKCVTPNDIYYGIFQFDRKTYFPNVPKQNILDYPELSIEKLNEVIKTYEFYIKKTGLEVTNENLYFIHNQGIAGLAYMAFMNQPYDDKLQYKINWAVKDKSGNILTPTSIGITTKGYSGLQLNANINENYKNLTGKNLHKNIIPSEFYNSAIVEMKKKFNKVKEKINKKGVISISGSLSTLNEPTYFESHPITKNIEGIGNNDFYNLEVLRKSAGIVQKSFNTNQDYVLNKELETALENSKNFLIQNNIDEDENIIPINKPVFALSNYNLLENSISINENYINTVKVQFDPSFITAVEKFFSQFQWNHVKLKLFQGLPNDRIREKEIKVKNIFTDRQAAEVAQVELAKELGSYYTGKIVITFNPDVRYKTEVFIVDTVNKISGIVLVKNYEHSFTEMGAITIIEPEMKIKFSSLMEDLWVTENIFSFFGYIEQPLVNINSNLKPTVDLKVLDQLSAIKSNSNNFLPITIDNHCVTIEKKNGKDEGVSAQYVENNLKSKLPLKIYPIRKDGRMLFPESDLYGLQKSNFFTQLVLNLTNLFYGRTVGRLPLFVIGMGRGITSYVKSFWFLNYQGQLSKKALEQTDSVFAEPISPNEKEDASKYFRKIRTLFLKDKSVYNESKKIFKRPTTLNSITANIKNQEIAITCFNIKRLNINTIEDPESRNSLRLENIKNIVSEFDIFCLVEVYDSISGGKGEVEEQISEKFATDTELPISGNSDRILNNIKKDSKFSNYNITKHVITEKANVKEFAIIGYKKSGINVKLKEDKVGINLNSNAKLNQIKYVPKVDINFLNKIYTVSFVHIISQLTSKSAPNRPEMIKKNIDGVFEQLKSGNNIVMGDFNTNFVNAGDTIYVDGTYNLQHTNIEESKNMIPRIKNSTMITSDGNAGGIVDNVLTESNISQNTLAGIYQYSQMPIKDMYNEVSDHLPIFCIIVPPTGLFDLKNYYNDNLNGNSIK